MDYKCAYFLLWGILACKGELNQAEGTPVNVQDLNVFKTELQDIILNVKRELVLDINLAMFNMKQEMKTDVDNALRNAVESVSCLVPDDVLSDITSKIDTIDSNTKSLQLEIKNVHNSLTSQIKGFESNNFNSKFQNEIDIFGGQVGNVEMTVDAINEKTDMLRNNIEMQRKVLEEVDTNVHILWNTTQELQESDYHQENKTDLLLEEIKTINRKIDNNEDNVKTNVNNLQKLVTTSKIILSKMEDNSSLIESITNARTYVSLKINDLHGSITEVIKVANNTLDKVNKNEESVNQFEQILESIKDKIEDNNGNLLDINSTTLSHIFSGIEGLQRSMTETIRIIDGNHKATVTSIDLVGRDVTSVKDKVGNGITIANSIESIVQSLLQRGTSLGNTVENLRILSSSASNNLIELNNVINSVDGKVSSGQSTINNLSNRIGNIKSTINSINNKVGSIESKSTQESGCVFPFRFKGIVFNSCTTMEANEPWCSTKTDSVHNHVDKQWKYCQDSKPCRFPFIDGGKTYYSCTKAWCSTKTDRNNKHVAKYWKIC